MYHLFIVYFPQKFAELVSLEVIILDNNKFTGKINNLGFYITSIDHIMKFRTYSLGHWKAS
jgi:hypothetical protein